MRRDRFQVVWLGLLVAVAPCLSGHGGQMVITSSVPSSVDAEISPWCCLPMLCRSQRTPRAAPMSSGIANKAAISSGNSKKATKSGGLALRLKTDSRKLIGIGATVILAASIPFRSVCALARGSTGAPRDQVGTLTSEEEYLQNLASTRAFVDGQPKRTFLENALRGRELILRSMETGHIDQSWRVFAAMGALSGLVWGAVAYESAVAIAKSLGRQLTYLGTFWLGKLLGQDEDTESG